MAENWTLQEKSSIFHGSTGRARVPSLGSAAEGKARGASNKGFWQSGDVRSERGRDPLGWVTWELGPWSSTEDDFARLQIFGNVRRHFWLSQVGVGVLLASSG